MASCWMNFTLEILTAAPVVSTKVSPLFFFSITTSSGRPNPVQIWYIPINTSLHASGACVSRVSSAKIVLSLETFCLMGWYFLFYLRWLWNQAVTGNWSQSNVPGESTQRRPGSMHLLPPLGHCGTARPGDTRTQQTNTQWQKLVRSQYCTFNVLI